MPAHSAVILEKSFNWSEGPNGGSSSRHCVAVEVPGLALPGTLLALCRRRPLHKKKNIVFYDYFDMKTDTMQAELYLFS